MTRALIIENARILDPASRRDMNGAVLCDDGRILDVVAGAAPGAPANVTRVDAGGLILAPGLIDMRVFTGEPGFEYRETLMSASRAAAAGGVTSFVMMPDANPVIDDAALVDFVLRRARDTANVNVLPSAALTKGLAGTDITEFGLLKEAGAICLTDGRRTVADTAVLRAAFTYAANFGMPVVHHVADAALVADGVMNEGLFATGLGLKGIPREAETIPLERDLQLAALTGVRYHAAQISCAASVEIVRRHKKSNAMISCGVSINSLTLNENDVGAYKTFFKLNPPLRSETDRQAVVAALGAGVIDVIHSDHDPQDSEVKRQPFAEAANGAIGLETMLAAALRLHHADEIGLMDLLGAMTCRPARILGLSAGRIAKGAPADLILVDPDYPWVVSEAAIRSRARNTAFEGARFSGKVMATFVGGVEVFRHTGE
ncbi:MAG: dihydroorotase [Alphaproteobacteria bacterium]|nr:dihydroorotase [Alphaproteobacteria bacterium]